MARATRGTRYKLPPQKFARDDIVLSLPAPPPAVWNPHNPPDKTSDHKDEDRFGRHRKWLVQNYPEVEWVFKGWDDFTPRDEHQVEGGKRRVYVNEVYGMYEVREWNHAIDQKLKTKRLLRALDPNVELSSDGEDEKCRSGALRGEEEGADLDFQIEGIKNVEDEATVTFLSSAVKRPGILHGYSPYPQQSAGMRAGMPPAMGQFTPANIRTQEQTFTEPPQPLRAPSTNTQEIWDSILAQASPGRVPTNPGWESLHPIAPSLTDLPMNQIANSNYGAREENNELPRKKAKRDIPKHTRVSADPGWAVEQQQKQARKKAIQELSRKTLSKPKFDKSARNLVAPGGPMIKIGPAIEISTAPTEQPQATSTRAEPASFPNRPDGKSQAPTPTTGINIFPRPKAGEKYKTYVYLDLKAERLPAAFRVLILDIDNAAEKLKSYEQHIDFHYLKTVTSLERSIIYRMLMDPVTREKEQRDIFAEGRTNMKRKFWDFETKLMTAVKAAGVSVDATQLPGHQEMAPAQSTGQLMRIIHLEQLVERQLVIVQRLLMFQSYVSHYQGQATNKEMENFMACIRWATREFQCALVASWVTEADAARAEKLRTGGGLQWYKLKDGDTEDRVIDLLEGQVYEVPKGWRPGMPGAEKISKQPSFGDVAKTPLNVPGGKKFSATAANEGSPSRGKVQQVSQSPTRDAESAHAQGQKQWSKTQNMSVPSCQQFEKALRETVQELPLQAEPFTKAMGAGQLNDAATGKCPSRSFQDQATSQMFQPQNQATGQMFQIQNQATGQMFQPQNQVTSQMFETQNHETGQMSQPQDQATSQILPLQHQATSQMPFASASTTMHMSLHGQSNSTPAYGCSPLRNQPQLWPHMPPTPTAAMRQSFNPATMSSMLHHSRQQVVSGSNQASDMIASGMNSLIDPMLFTQSNAMNAYVVSNNATLATPHPLQTSPYARQQCQMVQQQQAQFDAASGIDYTGFAIPHIPASAVFNPSAAAPVYITSNPGTGGVQNTGLVPVVRSVRTPVQGISDAGASPIGSSAYHTPPSGTAKYPSSPLNQQSYVSEEESVFIQATSPSPVKRRVKKRKKVEAEAGDEEGVRDKGKGKGKDVESGGVSVGNYYGLQNVMLGAGGVGNGIDGLNGGNRRAPVQPRQSVQSRQALRDAAGRVRSGYDDYARGMGMGMGR